MPVARPGNRPDAIMRDTAGPLSRMKSSPVSVPRSTRNIDYRVLTSFMPGKMVPIAAIPLLREERLRMSRFRLNFEQMETAEILMNAVNVRVLAYLVPNLAFDRFDGIDALNRSYQKIPSYEPAGPVTPYFQSAVAGAHGWSPILKAMGKHLKVGSTYNTAYVEAYNECWNFRAKNRSPDIPLRTLTDHTLAKAFWTHQQFAHIVPDFDQALIDGEVPLNVTAGSLPVRGIGIKTGTSPGSLSTITQNEAKGPPAVTYQSGWLAPTAATLHIQSSPGGAGHAPVGYPDVFAEMATNGITVSLSNIELARKTQAFAALRKQYTGHDDDYIIDLLMDGLSVPEQQWRSPILLADRSTIVGMAKRYASDSADLTASVVNGATFIDLAITTPVVPTGGVVMIMVEVTPEQLFERQQDPYLAITDQEYLPEFLRDTLDPEKVEVVLNQYIDVDHATPSGTFGYAPLNHKWNHQNVGIGGKFFRPTVDAPTDEDRQRLWACETANPTLSADFYLCSSIHTKPFVVTNADPYECVMRGIASVDGLTVFGQLLIEATDDYDTIMGKAPMGRITKPGSLETEAEGDTEAAQSE